MKKVIKEHKAEVIIVDEVIHLCDRCGCEIQDPDDFGKEYNIIQTKTGMNYPEYGGYDNEYELCSDCYSYMTTLLNDDITKYEKCEITE